VKVLSVSGQRVSLSMRDVDQATGQDLLPGARLAADGVNPSGPAGGDAPGGLRGLSGIKVCALAEMPSHRCCARHPCFTMVRKSRTCFSSRSYRHQ
jgi:hypothetical protein